MTTFQIMADSVFYSKKPKDAAYKIKTRFATECSKPQDFTFDKFASDVERGRTFCPAIIAPTVNTKGNLSHSAEGFQRQQVFFVDIDNDEQVKVDGKKQKRRLPDGEYITSTQALDICQIYGIHPFIMYHSFSSTPELEKYRIGIRLDEITTDPAERERIVTAFMDIFGKAKDDSCSNADRIFFGGAPGCVFYKDPDAITPKSNLLAIWDAMQESKKAAKAPEGQTQPRPLPTDCKNPRFDANPDTLLKMIDPNTLSRKDWVKVTAGYKNAGGDPTFWESWCATYAEDDPKDDARTWRDAGKATTGEPCGLGTLKYFAKDRNPAEYSNYMESLIESQRAQRRTDKARNAFRDPVPTGSAPAATAPAGDQQQPQELNSSDTQTAEPLPWYFYYDQRNALRVDPAKLWQHIHKHECYFWVGNGVSEGTRRYFYNQKRGVYEFMGDGRIKGKIQSYISNCKPTAVKSRDVNEAFNLLVNEDVYKPDSYLNADEMLVNFQNGLFDLRTWQLYKHSKKAILTVQLPLDFDPSRTYTLDDAPTFKHYLNDLTSGDTQTQQLILEYTGAALSNIPGYRFKSAMFLVGEPDAGKSQLILLLCALLGLENIAKVNFALLSERFQSGTIYGKRLVCDPDMKVTQRASDTSLFKNVTGGDPIQIEFKGLNPFTTIHRGYFLFASNDMPKWSGGADEAMYNRMLVIECKNSIPAERRDPQLLQKMLNERQAIVYLAFQALLGAVQRGYRFTRPAALGQTLNQLRRNNCPAIDFYESQCMTYPDADKNEKHCIRTRFLHEAFTRWCRSNAPSAYVPSKKEFYRDILKYLHLPDKSLKRWLHGYEYYTFTLTADAKEELGVFDSLE